MNLNTISLYYWRHEALIPLKLADVSLYTIYLSMFAVDVPCFLPVPGFEEVAALTLAPWEVISSDSVETWGLKGIDNGNNDGSRHDKEQPTCVQQNQLYENKWW